MVGYPALSDAARNMEQALAQVRTGKAPLTAELARSLGVDRDQLADLIETEERGLRERTE